MDDISAAGAARRYATVLATKLGFDEARTGEVAIAVTELATNLHRHARDGAVALRVARQYLGSSEEPAIDVVAMDAGPGLEDLDAHLRDGRSSAGTLGVGLGAVVRLATTFDGYSVPGRGTIVAARFGIERRRFDRIGRPAPPAGHVGAGLTRPMTGEVACGDAYAIRPTATGLVALLCDGLGHGPLAAGAAQRAVSVFLDAGEADVTALLTRLHRGLSHTRGAALAVVRIDGAVLSYAGLGNIAGKITTRGLPSKHLTSMPGIAGHQARTIRSFEYPLDPNAVTVLHTDGVSTRWTFDGQLALLGQDPQVVAASVLRDGGTRRDDAGVLVLRSAR
ncbi:SpoIIE family protein phosphatase [Cryptosporangium phraense]|uniref:SpoIIE family protein phosphatase n=1 Tax=Cryptosporangium phraense TaxID=2593070 RepID=A0A545AFD8_9ACTN|nr:SpoIIE family protein phosphatase [Cryptosporangium phraense]